MTADLRYPIGKFDPSLIINKEVIDESILKIERLSQKLRTSIKDFDDSQLNTPYRTDGWTVRQVIHHIADSHMHAYIRFHWALTEINPKIKAYDEQAWAELPYQNEAPVEDSISLLAYLHKKWALLLKNMSAEDFRKTYVHPKGDKVYTLNKVAALYAWHGDHHLAHITSLKERMNWR